MKKWLIGLLAAVLTLLRSDTGVIEEVCDPVPVPDGPLELRLETTPDGRGAQFRWRADGGDWADIGPVCTTEILTDEHCRGFTGAHVGLYAHDMAGLHGYADFDWLAVCCRRSEKG